MDHCGQSNENVWSAYLMRSFSCGVDGYSCHTLLLLCPCPLHMKSLVARSIGFILQLIRYPSNVGSMLRQSMGHYPKIAPKLGQDISFAEFVEPCFSPNAAIPRYSQFPFNPCPPTRHAINEITAFFKGEIVHDATQKITHLVPTP